MQTSTFRMDKQDPSVQHGVLYSISWEKTIMEKNIKKKRHTCITESPCCTVETGTACKSATLQLDSGMKNEKCFKTLLLSPYKRAEECEIS